MEDNVYKTDKQVNEEDNYSKFPYTCKTMCYIEVFNDGTVQQMRVNLNDALDTRNRLRNNESRLYCAWPGQWRTDLFKIVDIDKFIDAFLRK